MIRKQLGALPAQPMAPRERTRRDGRPGTGRL